MVSDFKKLCSNVIRGAVYGSSSLALSKTLFLSSSTTRFDLRAHLTISILGGSTVTTPSLLDRGPLTAL